MQDFVVLDWPGNSPDLNPIENCWNLMKSKLKEYEFSNINQLREKLIQLWIEMPVEYFTNLAESMPRRLKLVIEKDGWMTKY
jgi:hypothetical protein